MSKHLAYSTRWAPKANQVPSLSNAGAANAAIRRAGVFAVVGPGILGRVLVFTVLMGFCLQGAPAQELSPETLLRRGKRHETPADLMQKVVTRAEEAGLPPETIGQLLHPVVSSAQKNHPTKPLLLTALEGLSKQAPADQLTAALKTFRQQIETAAHLVSRRPPPPDFPEESKARLQLIESVADAHRRGLSWAVVRQLHEALSEAREKPSFSVLTATFEVAPTVPGSRFSPRSVRTLLVAAVAEGYSETDIRKLGDILRQVPSEHPPTVILHATTRAVEQARSPTETGTFAFTTAPQSGPFGTAGLPIDVPPGLPPPTQLPTQRPEETDPPRSNYPGLP